MNIEKLENLKTRFNLLFPSEKKSGLTKNITNQIEQKLEIKLPSDFCCISQFFRGDNGPVFPSGMYSYNPLVSDWNICDQTITLKKSVRLPRNLIILAEPSESVIIMQIEDNLGITSKVYWLSTGDAYNLIEGKPLVDNPIIYPTFTDFFSYLLDEEEKQRAEKAAG